MGVRENTTRKKLLQDATLTLKKCVDICRSFEKTFQQMKEINSETIKEFWKKGYDQAQEKTRNTHRTQSQRSGHISCGDCGYRHINEKGRSPAWQKACAKCGIFNNVVKKCRSKPQAHQTSGNWRNKTKVHRMEELDSESSEEAFVWTVDRKDVNAIQNGRRPSKLHTVVDIQGKSVECQLDSGSTVNVLPKSVYLKVFNDDQLESVSQTDMTLVMFNKSGMKPVGTRRVQISNPRNRKKYSVECVIVEGKVTPILGARVIQAMNLVTVNRQNMFRRKRLYSRRTYYKHKRSRLNRQSLMGLENWEGNYIWRLTVALLQLRYQYVEYQYSWKGMSRVNLHG